jgi:hypothetical protein
VARYRVGHTDEVAVTDNSGHHALAGPHEHAGVAVRAANTTRVTPIGVHVAGSVTARNAGARALDSRRRAPPRVNVAGTLTPTANRRRGALLA